MLNGPYYIISDNHFSMINNSEEYERREKLFSVFNKIKEKGVGTLIIEVIFLIIGLNINMKFQKDTRVY